jgi:hypothetical protein
MESKSFSIENLKGLTDEEVILIYKNIENKHYELKMFLNNLVKLQRYALAKLFKNKVEIIETLKYYEEVFAKEKKYTDNEVIQLIDNFRNSHETDLIKWFNLNKK